MAEKVIANYKGKVELAIKDGTFVELTNVQTFGISMDQEQQDRNSYGTGWRQSFITTKSLEVSVEATFDAENEGHKYLRELALGDPIDQNGVQIKLTLPIEDAANSTPAELLLEGAISFSDILGGAAEELTPINFTLAQNGEPKYTPEAA